MALHDVLSNPVEAAEKAIRHGAEKAGRITSTAKKAYKAGKDAGLKSPSATGTVKMPKLNKSHAGLAAAAAGGALAHRAHVKRRAKQFMKKEMGESRAERILNQMGEAAPAPMQKVISQHGKKIAQYKAKQNKKNLERQAALYHYGARMY